MEGKKIKAMTISLEENEINEIEIERIKNRLNDLKQDIAKLNDYRDRWTDFDVAVICWLLAHDTDELEFWKETELWKKKQ
ncbi:MAG: hypothetical protein OIN66_11350 [Candidatus Methanoperedens sp.]|nr:hypothetical protein [Candidatus Methanoperedens sp.]